MDRQRLRHLALSSQGFHARLNDGTGLHGLGCSRNSRNATAKSSASV
jgi:hypothetical protein